MAEMESNKARNVMVRVLPELIALLRRLGFACDAI